MDSRKKFIDAVSKSDIQNLQILLEKGHKLKSEDLQDALILGPQLYQIEQPGYQGIDPQVITLLEKYEAYPEGVANGTVRYVLTLLGNKNIFFNENYDDVNYEGCPNLTSPLSEYICRGDLAGVEYLVLEKNVSQRPLNQLFNPPICSANFIHHNRLFMSRESYLTSLCILFSRELLTQCAIAELFLTQPTDNLFSIIEKEASLEKQTEKNNIYNFSTNTIKYLPFFTWVILFNRLDLFNAPAFIHLLEAFPIATFESIKIAAALEYKTYIANVIKSINSLTPGGHQLLEKLNIKEDQSISEQIEVLFPFIQKNWNKSEEESSRDNVLLPQNQLNQKAQSSFCLFQPKPEKLLQSAKPNDLASSKTPGNLN